ncbi:hypothetical protein COF51_06930 [Bacillus pseudomycoides]|uniref:hypothetical protein n=1 Tax=Bacillus pseudomycoides TaxID=64104 RepID=UPI000BF7F5C1|nr:hypothetical protein [Bacillus pseudomycoides]PGE98897.1 hypothetical protein COM62_03280 [Bacillus pseudomycoides]PHE39414.1 hypothetical protein COF51_06930 [Bacillus pseudomycoides]
MEEENFETRTRDLLENILKDFCIDVLNNDILFERIVQDFIKTKQFNNGFEKVVEKELWAFRNRIGTQDYLFSINELIDIHFDWEIRKDKARQFYFSEQLRQMNE